MIRYKLKKIEHDKIQAQQIEHDKIQAQVHWEKLLTFMFLHWYLLILIQLMYLVSPIDLIPDVIPVIGLADDFAFIVYPWYWRFSPQPYMMVNRGYIGPGVIIVLQFFYKILMKAMESPQNYTKPSPTTVLKPPKQDDAFFKGKIGYCCSHCNMMLLDQNLIREHVKHKHPLNPKPQQYSQMLLWDYFRACYLCNRTQTYHLSDAECWPMGNKMCFDCTEKNLIYDDYQGKYWLNCHKCEKKHELSMEHGLFCELLSGKITEQSIIDICD